MNENELKLLPCPFCNEQPIIDVRTYGSSPKNVHIDFMIRCTKCGCHITGVDETCILSMDKKGKLIY